MEKFYIILTTIMIGWIIGVVFLGVGITLHLAHTGPIPIPI